MVKQDEGPIGSDALIFILQIHEGKKILTDILFGVARYDMPMCPCAQ
jgi:hypothetical protein